MYNMLRSETIVKQNLAIASQRRKYKYKTIDFRRDHVFHMILIKAHL